MPSTTTPSIAMSSPTHNILWATHHKGEKREAYLRAASEHGWGQTGGPRCGGMSLLREQDGQIMVLPALCGCWRCALCGPRRAAWLTAQIARLVEAQELERFWTLTLIRSVDDPTPADVEKANRHLTASFNRFRLAARRVYPAFQYVWSREHTEARWPHLHLITNLPLSRSALSALWFKATGGSFIVDAKPREIIRSGSYLAKYVCDEAVSEVRPKYARAFSKSRAVRMEPFRPKSQHPQSWRMAHRAYWSTVTLRISLGDSVARQKTQGAPWCVLTLAEASKVTQWSDVAVETPWPEGEPLPRPPLPEWQGAGPMTWYQ
jgi:hypothetical protein